MAGRDNTNPFLFRGSAGHSLKNLVSTALAGSRRTTSRSSEAKAQRIKVIITAPKMKPSMPSLSDEDNDSVGPRKSRRIPAPTTVHKRGGNTTGAAVTERRPDYANATATRDAASWPPAKAQA